MNEEKVGNQSIKEEILKGLESDKDQDSQKWQQRIDKLRSFMPTGNIIEDARMFFEASGQDPNKIDSIYDFTNPKSTAEYFEALFVALSNVAGYSDLSTEFYELKREKIKQILGS